MATDPYTAIYRASRERNPPRQVANDESLLERTIREDRDNQLRLDVMASPSPDAVARQTRLARETDTPPGLIDDPDQVERARNADRLTEVFGRYPSFGRHFAANPRAAVAAQDDHESLGLLGRAFDILKDPVMAFAKAVDAFDRQDRGKDMGAATPIMAGVAGLLGDPGVRVRTPDILAKSPAALASGGLSNAAGAFGYARGLFENAGFRATATLAQIGAEYFDREAEAMRPKTGDWLKDQILGGIGNVPSTVTTLGVGLAGRAAGLTIKGASLAGAATGGVIAGGQSYNEAREQGVDPALSFLYANADLASEIAGEYLGTRKFLQLTDAGANVLTRFVKSQVPEQIGEQFSTVAQSFSAWAVLPENRGKTLGEWAMTLPGEMAATVVQTFVAGGVSNVTISAFEKALDTYGERARREAGNRLGDMARKSLRARQEAAFLDKASKAFEGSKFHGRDAVDYAAMLESYANENGVSEIYVPGEAVRALYQTDDFDWDADPFAAFESEANEAAASGGDVVIPVGRLGELASSKSWAALKDDVRLSAGGMSKREADEFDAAMDDVLAELSDEMAAREQSDAAQRTAREKLTDSIASKFASAGLTAPTARQVAELVAAHAQTRASRFGIELTGSEYDDLTVRQVLPESARPFVKRTEKAVEVDPALVKAVKAATKRGPSLIEFLAKRGGIDDAGGDLASMGAARLSGVARKGERKLIRRDRDTIRAEGIEADEFGLDYALTAAIEAGYFPELQGAQDTYAQLPEIDALLDAIRAELHGKKRYAAGNVGDRDTAAAEVRDVLEQAGYDPARMKEADIRDALAQMYEQDERGGLTQTDPKSEAFKRWFGDSKVVDKDGNPLVVYHGTGAEFEAFAPERKGENTKHPGSGLGFFFGAKLHTAETYADIAARGSYGGQATGTPVVVPVYLSIQNPKRYATASEFYAEADQWAGRDEEWRNSLVEQGFDGIIVRDDMEEIVAFEPTQIKSVNNRGTFDPADARILYQGLFGDDQGTDPNKAKVQADKLKLRAEAPLRGQNKTGKQQDGTMGLGLFDAAQQRSLFQAAFHGSPHIFDRFSLDKIGTGEGHQAYGFGLYFAGKKAVAAFYREALTSEKVKVGGKQIDDLDGFSELPEGTADIVRLALNDNKTVAQALASMRTARTVEIEEAADEPNKEAARKEWDQAIAFVQRFHGATMERENGRLYEVQIPEDDEYLLWDKPLSEQPEKVKAALAKLKGEGKEPEELTDDELFAALGGYEQTFSAKEKTGQGFYKEVSADKGGDAAASKMLHDLGIAGIKYLDGGSRADGDGSFNYVVFDDSRIAIQAYEQTYGEGARGRIIFDQGKAIIELFATANRSTALHELSHLWLEELRFDASLNDAPEQLKADWQTVQDWFAANGHPLNPDGSIPTEAHELWARSGERYLMEGKAPSTALQRLFETFRGWLTAIYRTVDQLKAPITPEIREVFDRLLATDEEIAAARERQNLADLFKTAADARMSEAEFSAYQQQANAARHEASGKLLDKTMRAVRRRVTKEWNDERAGLMEAKAAELDDLPLYRALRTVKTQPISEDWLVEEMGAEVLKQLPRRVPPIHRPGGNDPTIIAELSGFATAREMIAALIEAEAMHRQAKEGGDPRSMRQRAIEVSADAEMARRHGDPLNDGSIEREALEAVHNDMQGEVIATELRVLSRTTGKRPTPYALAKEWARNRVRSGLVKDEASPAAIQRYARAAAKAGKAAEAAMLKQDADEAFRQKQFQLLNNALVSEAKSAADEVDAAVKRMAKVAKARTMKSVDQDYLEQAQALLENVGLRNRSQVSIERQGAWEAWSAEREAEGFDVVVPRSFEATLGTTHYTRQPVETLLSLDEAVKQVMHLGRLKQTLLDNKERREFEAVVSEAVAGMGGMDQKPPSDRMEPSRWDSIKSKVAAIDAALLKMETVFDWLDQGDSNGVFNRIVFRPLAEAQENARLRMNDLIGRLNEAMAAIPKPTLKRWNDKVTGPLLNRETGNPFVFTRDQLVSMALNIGNAGNIDKLTGGYGWNEQAVRDFLNAELTQEEWAYVQQVWDTIDSLWPEIEALEKRLNGVAPEKVEAVPIETPYGTLRGGYFPVVYDPRRNYDAEANAAKGRDLFENIYTRATTPKGFTKERTQVQRPIHLSLSVINRHVAEVVHDLTHREAIMQADKFLSDKRIMKAVDETLGPEIRKAFRPWLQRIANQWAYDRAGMAGVEGFLKKMRINATVVGMGFRFTTVLVQAAGYSNSFEVVGARWVAPRLRDAVNPEAWRFVLDKSQEVAARMNTLDRDINDAARRAAGAGKLSAINRFVFHGIGYMDRVVTVPTWLGAYDKALAAGMSDEDAVYAADKAVRQSQGSGAAKDLSAIQSGRGAVGELGKYLTMFYSFMSALYQRQRSLGRDTMRGKDIPKLLARAWWLIVVPPLLAEILSRGPPDDDEDEATWAMQAIMGQFFGPIPLVRDAVPALIRNARDEPSFGYRFTPAQGGIETLIRVGNDIEKIAEGKETKRATRDVIELTGYATGSGFATGQIAAATQFLVDVGSGDADPEGFWQWYEGLATGRIKEDAD